MAPCRLRLLARAHCPRSRASHAHDGGPSPPPKCPSLPAGANRAKHHRARPRHADTPARPQSMRLASPSRPLCPTAHVRVRAQAPSLAIDVAAASLPQLDAPGQTRCCRCHRNHRHCRPSQPPTPRPLTPLPQPSRIQPAPLPPAVSPPRPTALLSRAGRSRAAKTTTSSRSTLSNPNASPPPPAPPRRGQSLPRVAS